MRISCNDRCSSKIAANAAVTAIVTIVLLTQSVGAKEYDGNPPSLSGQGASYPAEVYDSWSSGYENYRKDFVNVNVDYLATGSAYGIAAVTAFNSVANNSYGATDSPLTDADYSRNPDLQLVPIVAGSVVMAYNIPNLQQLNLSKALIVGIYNGTYAYWNDTAIKAANPTGLMPNQRIRVVARVDYSGTTQIFTSALSLFDPAWNQTYGTFSAGYDENNDRPIVWNASAIELYGRLNRGMSGIILSYRYSIGYLSSADQTVTDLFYTSILEEGVPLKPQLSVIQKAMSRSTPYLGSRLTANLVDFVEPGEYPIIGYSYFIIRMTTLQDCDEATELIRYMEWTQTDSFAVGQVEDFSMTSMTTDIYQTILTDVLMQVTCADGQNVYDLVQDQLHYEYIQQQTWRLPVMIIVPIVGCGILALIGWIIAQQVKLRRALSGDEWHIHQHHIKIGWSRKDGMVDSNAGIGSAISMATSMASNISITAGQHVWGVGTLVGDKVVCLREITMPVDFHVSEVRHAILWMKLKAVHVNVLQLYGVTDIDQEWYIVSEHAPKGTLSDVVQNDKYKLDDNIKFSLAMDLAAGMAFLHGCGIIHGRLNSENAFIDQKWNVKVSDWEYAKLTVATEAKSRKRSQVAPLPNGTIKTFAIEEDPNIKARKSFFSDPRLLRDPSIEPTKASDVYSFAVVLVEIFTREDPYSELSISAMEPVEIVESIKRNDIRPIVDTLKPPAVAALIASAWDADASKRLAFPPLRKALKAAKPSRKSIMDSMMEVLEGYVNQLEEKVHERTLELAGANSNLTNLLNKILPPSVAEALQRGETVQPECFDSVTIFFSDIVGFTTLSASSSPMEVVNMLNDLYTAFDAVVDNHDVYKVETIGDAYMVISGLPKKNGTKHALNISMMSLDLLESASSFKVRHRPGYTLQLRAGVHSGPVVAGVVGHKMPRYTLFGDTVNTASRMESTSMAMKIQISQSTYDLLEEYGKFTVESREAFNVKGKGLMQTYFLLGIDGYEPMTKKLQNMELM